MFNISKRTKKILLGVTVAGMLVITYKSWTKPQSVENTP